MNLTIYFIYQEFERFLVTEKGLPFDQVKVNFGVPDKRQIRDRKETKRKNERKKRHDQR
jgi:hypothetical protein